MKVLKIGAKGCPGCVIMKPRWDQIEKENPWLKTEYFDADLQKDQLAQYKIDELPTFIFLDDQGNELERRKGIVSKDALLKIINNY